MNQRLAHVAAIYAVLMVGTLPAKANTVVVSVLTPHPGAGGIVVAASEYLQESWTQTNDFQNVIISAWLFGTYVNSAYVPTSGTAYLTSDAQGFERQQDFIFPDPAESLATRVTLFSGLNLPAGTYFLTLASTDPFGGGWTWVNPDSMLQAPQVTLGAGVTLQNLGYAQDSCPGGVNCINHGDPPMSAFIPAGPQAPALFDVRATETSASIPEPASVVLAGIGIFGLIRLAKRTSGNHCE